VTGPAIDAAGSDLDVTVGLAALVRLLRDHRLRSIALMTDGRDWLRLTFDDDATLDVPRVCLTMVGQDSPPVIPNPRRAAPPRVDIFAAQAQSAEAALDTH
jgi:hypothetical protein